MEGKGILYKYLGGVDAFPICLDEKDPDKIIEIGRALQPSFGGYNLEDIAQPKSTFSNMPRQRQAMKRPTLEMNTVDAQQRELTEGQQVMVKNTQGAIVAWVHVTDDIHQGVVSLPGKWWSVPHETGAVANLLTASSWSRGGQPAYNDTFVDVVKSSQR